MNGLGTRPRSSDQLHLRRYDLYDIAYLAGGHIRVADTAVVALAETGRIRVCPHGRLVLVELRRRHSVEAAALDVVGGRGWRDLASVRWRFAIDPRVTAIAERLEQEGLLRRVTFPAAARRRPTLRCTRAGRRLLRQLRRQPPVGGSPRAVALRGTAGLPDRRLCEDIFGPFSPSRSPIGRSRPPRADGPPAVPSGHTGVRSDGADLARWYGRR